LENFVHFQKNGGIATVTINNPPMNVLSNQVVHELGEIFTAIEKDTEIVVVVLTGKGNRAFMAGADIKEFPQLIETEDKKEAVMQQHHVLNQIDFLSKPTIAMLNGIAFGGGCELALTCDLRIAEAHAQLGLPEIKLGLFPGGGGTQRLPRLIGEAKAKELMFTGEAVSAEEAERIGLVNQVVTSDEGMDAARRLAQKIAGYSLPALSLVKRAVDMGAERPIQEGLENEAELFEQVFQTEDVKEGVAAFIEKRPPNFRNK
jgi:enoyl-CoA hydratase